MLVPAVTLLLLMSKFVLCLLCDNMGSLGKHFSVLSLHDVKSGLQRGLGGHSRKGGLLILVLMHLASQAPADHPFIPFFFFFKVIFYKNPTSQLGFCLISPGISTIFQYTFHLV